MNTWIKANIGKLISRADKAQHDIGEVTAAVTQLGNTVGNTVNRVSAIETRLGGLTFLPLTQSEYDNLSEYDSMTVYIIIPDDDPPTL